jgi:hypothetical protein
MSKLKSNVINYNKQEALMSKLNIVKCGKTYFLETIDGEGEPDEVLNPSDGKDVPKIVELLTPNAINELASSRQALRTANLIRLLPKDAQQKVLGQEQTRLALSVAGLVPEMKSIIRSWGEIRPELGFQKKIRWHSLCTFQ